MRRGIAKPWLFEESNPEGRYEVQGAAALSSVIARLDRAPQYCRALGTFRMAKDASAPDTGSPAFGVRG
jgi:hypothetical protein